MDSTSLSDPPQLAELIERAKAWLASLTPEERETHFEVQRRSWVRSELAWGDEGTRTVR